MLQPSANNGFYFTSIFQIIWKFLSLANSNPESYILVRRFWECSCPFRKEIGGGEWTADVVPPWSLSPVFTSLYDTLPLSMGRVCDLFLQKMVKVMGCMWITCVRLHRAIYIGPLLMESLHRWLWRSKLLWILQLQGSEYCRPPRWAGSLSCSWASRGDLTLALWMQLHVGAWSREASWAISWLPQTVI